MGGLKAGSTVVPLRLDIELSCGPVEIGGLTSNSLGPGAAMAQHNWQSTFCIDEAALSCPASLCSIML